MPNNANKEPAIENILKRLEIEPTGRYENKFYIIELENSDDYARMYTKLNKKTENTEYPTFGTNESDSTVKITNYFGIEEENIRYLLFLIADFKTDKYYLKIGRFDIATLGA